MKKNALLMFAVAAMLAALAAVPASAQFGALEGDVKGADGKGLVGAQILIERTDIKGNYKVKTDKKGHYFHGGLPLGTYNVTLMEGDQIRDRVQNVRVRLGDPTPVNFDLKAAADRAMAAQAGVQLEQKPGAAPGADPPQLTPQQRAQIEEARKKQAADRERMEKLNKSFATGMEALKAKNFELAVTELEAAAATDPNQHVVFANLGEAYLGAARAKRGAEATEAFEKSIANYQKALTLKADDASYYNNYGLAQARAGKAAEAQEALNKAAQLDPPNAGRYFFNLGAILVNTGRGKEATEAFRRATGADPNYAEAWYQLGVSLLSDAQVDAKTGKTTPAAGTTEAFEKYIALAPTGPNAENAKQMLATLGSTVTTTIKADRPPASKKR